MFPLALVSSSELFHLMAHSVTYAGQRLHIASVSHIISLI